MCQETEPKPPTHALGGANLITAITNGIDHSEKIQQEHSKGGLTAISAAGVAALTLLYGEKFRVVGWHIVVGMSVVCGVTTWIFRSYAKSYGDRLDRLRKDLKEVLWLDEEARRARLAVEARDALGGALSPGFLTPANIRPGDSRAAAEERKEFFTLAAVCVWLLVLLASLTRPPHTPPVDRGEDSPVGSSKLSLGDHQSFVICPLGASCISMATFRSIDGCEDFQRWVESTCSNADDVELCPEILLTRLRSDQREGCTNLS